MPRKVVLVWCDAMEHSDGCREWSPPAGWKIVSLQPPPTGVTGFLALLEADGGQPYDAR